MDFKKKLRGFCSWIVPKISWVTWDTFRAVFNKGVFFELRGEDWDKIQTTLAKNYHIILTRNDSHLSTYLVSLGNKVATGKWGYFGHALMNLEGEDNPDPAHGFRLMEATRAGVHYSGFYEVFACDSVALLRPKGFSHDAWTAVMDKALAELGRPYDNDFDLTNDKSLSCVELVRAALQALPDYELKFSALEKMIKEHGDNLTPDMLYECPDLDIVFEIRR